MANPRISFGRYRILDSPGRCEVWAGEWIGGYSKLADVSIKDGKLTVVRAYVKIPKVIIRKLQEQIDEYEKRRVSEDRKARSVRQQQGVVQLRKGSKQPARR
jgi:hypothetical protein